VVDIDFAWVWLYEKCIIQPEQCGSCPIYKQSQFIFEISGYEPDIESHSVRAFFQLG
jgi:hypothetical protein